MNKAADAAQVKEWLKKHRAKVCPPAAALNCVDSNIYAGTYHLVTKLTGPNKRDGADPRQK